MNHPTDRLLALIRNEHFEYGFDTKADYLVAQSMSINPESTIHWLISTFHEYEHDYTILIGILRIIARLDYDTIGYAGLSMAVYALGCEDDREVQECGIRAIESWNQPWMAGVLRGVTGLPEWMQEYVNAVVEDLER